MRLLSRIRSLWHNLAHPGEVEAELDAEMDAYSSVLGAAEMHRVKEQVRDAKTGFALQILWQDIHYGFRTLRKSPTFTIVAILALAVGIGATTTIFSVVHGVLLSPLPYPEPDRLGMVFMHFAPQNAEWGTMSIADFLDWRAQNHAFEDPQLFTAGRYDVTGGREPEQVRGASVTAGFFSTLRVQPILGRTFAAHEDDAGAERLVVISEQWWERSFKRDPSVLGKQLNLNGTPCTVIGVMAGSFHFRSPVEQLWTNLRLTPPKRRGPFFYRAVARLKPGMTWERAQADANAAGIRIEQDNPKVYHHLSLPVVPLIEVFVSKVRSSLLAFLVAVFLLLAISIVNVACLLLSRSSAREREFALRASLGAGSGRLARQLLTESLLLSLLGGAAGWLLAYVGIQSLRAWNPGNLPRIEAIRLDGNVLLFALAISLLTGVLFGLVPILHSRGHALASSLRESGRGGTSGASRRRLQGILVVAEIALALVLVTNAGLLVRSFLLLQSVQAGFQTPPQRILSMDLSPNATNHQTDKQQVAFYDRVLERVRATPGVESVGVAEGLPPDQLGDYDSFVIQGQQFAPGESNPAIPVNRVSRGFFHTLGIPLRQGRYFTERDTADSPLVAIISESMARQYFPSGDAIGKRLKVSGPDIVIPYMEIVGIVGDLRYNGLQSDSGAAYYLSFSQSPGRREFLVVASKADNAAPLASAIRREIRELDPDAGVTSVETMEQSIGNSIAQPRFRTMLLAVFAVCALLLAAIGIYGVIAYSVSQRTQEIGIRMALGAQRLDVLRRVITEGLTLALGGTLLGLLGASLTTRLLQTLLFSVKSTDLAAFTAGPLILIVVALLACFIPACRAARVDPVIALRHE